MKTEVRVRTFDENGNVVHEVEQVEEDLRVDDLLTVVVDTDGIGISTGVGGRPKNRPSPSN